MNINNSTIKYLRKILVNPISREEEALIKKSVKDMGSMDAELMVPLSHYNHWLNMAKIEAYEANKYISLYENESSTYRRAELADFIVRKKRTVELYMHRASSYMKKYRALKNSIDKKTVKMPLTTTPEVSAA